MSRIAIPARDEVPTGSQAMLATTAKQLRFVPNIFRAASISPDVLTALIDLRATISDALDGHILARLALAISQINECRYCLSLHTHLGMNYGGLSPTEMMLNRRGTSSNVKFAVLLTFAQKVMRERGKVTGDDLHAMHEAGYSDAQVIEVVTASVYYLLTNLINNVFDTDIDIPKIDVALAPGADAS
jgi:uncharacterized peroxidase-related enzyme